MPALSIAQVGSLLLALLTTVARAGLRIGLLVAGGYVCVRLLRAGLAHLEAVLVRLGEPKEAVPGATRKRVATLVGLVRTIGLVLLWGLVAVLALDQLGLNVAPLLAGAGIAGLAVGFGAQNLVRDLISGFFLVLEDQVRVGDVAIVNGTSGLVEAITFRTIVLRDLAGVVHVFPHGAVNTLSNMTKEWSAYVIDVGVAYKEDTDRVVTVMRQVAEELRADPTCGPAMLGPIEIFGVDAFDESAVTIKARLKTLPLQQWAVGREYRRRLKKAFDAEGIEIPVPHRSIYVGAATQPLQVLVREVAGGGEDGRRPA